MPGPPGSPTWTTPPGDDGLPGEWWHREGMQTSSDTLTTIPLATADELAVARIGGSHADSVNELIADLAPRAVLSSYYETHRDEIERVAAGARVDQVLGRSA